MKRPTPRGVLGEWVELVLAGHPHAPAAPAPCDHDDEQLALWVLYELHYRGFEDTDPDADWWPGLVAVRRDLEARLERRWRTRVARADLPGFPSFPGHSGHSEHSGHSGPVAEGDLAPDTDVAEAFFALCDFDAGESVARFVQREATRGQVEQILRQRSIYHVKEQDAAMWALPRLDDDTKAHLMCIAADEYGNGRPEALHARMWAQGMAACGLDDAYGAYIDEALAEVVEQNNLASMFGLNRRLIPAALGHLAAFEVTSAVPSRRLARGLERLGMPEAILAYFHEHMVADSVHEQVAVRRMLGSYLASHPDDRGDVFWGAAVCLLAEGAAATALLGHVRDATLRQST